MVTTRTDATAYFAARYGPLVRVEVVGDRFDRLDAADDRVAGRRDQLVHCRAGGVGRLQDESLHAGVGVAARELEVDRAGRPGRDRDLDVRTELLAEGGDLLRRVLPAVPAAGRAGPAVGGPDSPPITSGGCGRWTGRGRWITFENATKRPSKSGAGSSHSVCMAARYSSVRAPRSARVEPSARSSASR